MTCRRQKPLSERGHRNTETLGLKARQAWEGRLILSLRRLLLCFRNISHGSGSFEGNDGEKMSNDQWCHYYGSLVSVTVSSQQRSALSISSRVQKCMLVFFLCPLISAKSKHYGRVWQTVLNFIVAKTFLTLLCVFTSRNDEHTQIIRHSPSMTRLIKILNSAIIKLFSLFVVPCSCSQAATFIISDNCLSDTP